MVEGGVGAAMKENVGRKEADKQDGMKEGEGKGLNRRMEDI